MDDGLRQYWPRHARGRPDALAAGQLENVVVGHDVVDPGFSARAGHAQWHPMVGGAGVAVVLLHGRRRNKTVQHPGVEHKRWAGLVVELLPVRLEAPPG